MTPRTTLTPGAPWPTAAELVAAIAAANERTAANLALQIKLERARFARSEKRKIKKVKP